MKSPDKHVTQPTHQSQPAANTTNTRVEEMLVNSLLTDETAISEVAAWFTPEMFTNPDMAFIYRAILAQYQRGERADMLTTEAEMQRLDAAHFQKINGLAILSDSLPHLRHAGNVVKYALLVKEYYLKCSLNTLCLLFAGKALAPEQQAAEMIREIEQALLALRETGQAGSSITPLAELAAHTVDIHHMRLMGGKVTTCVQTGISEFDAITGGLHNGELYVGAGRPSDGKSAVALQIAMNAARAGKHVCFFSLEMTDTQIVNRLFAGQGNIDPAHLRISGLTEQEMQEMEELVEDWKTLPFYLNYTPSNNVETIRAQAMLQARKGRCDLVVVDYLHLLDMRPGKGETLEQVIARNIRALKRLANELDRPVLVLSQMNRASETRADRRHLPILSDLRDSGTIEQVADCVFFIYRPERHGVTKDENTGESLIGVGKLYIAKNRNGATGIARYRYNKSYTRITDY